MLGLIDREALFPKAGIPIYESPAIAVRAFLHGIHYRKTRELLSRISHQDPEFRGNLAKQIGRSTAES